MKEKFIDNFITDNRYRYLTNGLKTTLIITFFALIIGVLLGFIVAVVRVSHDKTESGNRKMSVGKFFLKIANYVCKLYLTVVRGTPVVVQLMIIYYIIFADFSINKVLVAIIAFGLNSGAYVAEIVRSGINSIDDGQMEAGRSLGFSYVQTMIHIVLPQAFRNVVPALANEFITLLKETSVSGYIAVADLTKGGDIIRSRTYEPFFPLIAVALVYLVLVIIFTALVGKLERRFKNSER